MTPSQFRILSQDFDRIVSTLGDRLNVLSGSTIVITGCCGLIGSYFLDLFAYLNISLFKNPIRIIGIDNGLVGKWDRIEHLDGRSDIKIIKSDLGGVEFDYHVDWIINAAGVASPVLYKQFPVQTMQANVLGLWNLLEHKFDELSGLLHFSSSEIYADPDILPTPETYIGRVSTIGPRSSYDSSKCFSETLCRIYFEQFGVPMKMVRPFNCYDDQTEVLTEFGWKKFSDVIYGERVATLNRDNWELEYHQPVAFQKIPFRGEMLRFHSISHDIQVTPEHKMWVKRGREETSYWKFVGAQEIVSDPSGYRYVQARGVKKWTGLTPSAVIIPRTYDAIGRSIGSRDGGVEKRVPSKLWAEFAGWYVSEGCSFIAGESAHTVVISQHKTINPEHYERIRQVVKEMGFAPYLHPNGHDIKIHSRQLYFAVQQFGAGANNKQIPQYMMQWDSEHLESLYTALMNGDGCATGDRYQTTSPKLADQFTEICLKIGRCTVVTKEERKAETHSDIWRIHISRGDRQIGNNGTVHVQTVPYDGYVYDLTVQNHIIFVRRNGKAVWSSNCYGPGHKLDDGRIIPQLMKSLITGEKFPIHGRGSATRSYCYLSDAVNQLLAVLLDGENGEVYNVGDGTSEISVRELLNLAQEIFDGRPETETINDPNPLKDAPTRRRPDVSKVLKLVSAPEVGLKEGLLRTYEWHREEG